MSLWEELSGLTKAAAPVVVAPAAPTAEPAPVTVAESHEPTIVEYQSEPVVSLPVGRAPEGMELVEKLTGKTRGYLRPDGLFVAVAEEPEDELARLSEADRAPVIPEDEVRVDLSQRTSGRIKFLTATYESEREDPAYPARRVARLANDVHRGLAARTSEPFNPEKSKNAEAIKQWLS
jgi:hypothetical protein